MDRREPNYMIQGHGWIHNSSLKLSYTTFIMEKVTFLFLEKVELLSL
jgi:hypothetical protein